MEFEEQTFSATTSAGKFKTFGEMAEAPEAYICNCVAFKNHIPGERFDAIVWKPLFDQIVKQANDGQHVIVLLRTKEAAIEVSKSLGAEYPEIFYNMTKMRTFHSTQSDGSIFVTPYNNFKAQQASFPRFIWIVNIKDLVDSPIMKEAIGVYRDVAGTKVRDISFRMPPPPHAAT